MFCADYVASFFYHSALTLTLAQRKPEEVPEARSKWPIAALSGLLAAASIFPFDFVRDGAMPGKFKFRHSLSTVPYSLVFFGLYFNNRDRHDLSSQCQWALTSACGACLAEIPFDKAKLAMMGSRRTMLLANGLYIPFGAMILVMYDKSMSFYLEKNHNTEI